MFIHRFYLSQRDNPLARWNLPEDFSVVYTDVQGEMTIGGVFLRLYIANPGWVLRKPKEFIVELLEKWSTLVTNNACNVSIANTTSLIIVLKLFS